MPRTVSVAGVAAAYGAGVFDQYVNNAGNIAECPKNKRRNKDNTLNEVSNTALQPDAEVYGVKPLGVFFDYTMIGRFQGLKPGSSSTGLPAVSSRARSREA